ncbi:MAG: hypothetical protein IPH96_15700 [Saprospiraceae bacterium]|nr:hypothetical protein [Saprospiraceae bacterium]
MNFVYIDYDTFLQDKLDELSNDEYDEFIDLEISRINLALLNNKANLTLVSHYIIGRNIENLVNTRTIMNMDMKLYCMNSI